MKHYIHTCTSNHSHVYIYTTTDIHDSNLELHNLLLEAAKQQAYWNLGVL